MKKIVLALLAVAAIHTADAQKIKWDKGDLKVLKGQTQLSTEIIYEN